MTFRFKTKSRRNTTPLEKDEQFAIRKLMLSLGAREYVLGTKRKRTDYHGTMQTPGIADLQFFLPERRLGHANTRRFVVVEAKRERGSRFSSEQIEYRGLCLAAGVDYIGGCLNDVMAWLIDEGYIDAKNLPHYRQPAATEVR
jgi:hypothetical protein